MNVWKFFIFLSVYFLEYKYTESYLSMICKKALIKKNQTNSSDNFVKSSP